MTHQRSFFCVILCLIATTVCACQALGETAAIGELPAPFRADEFQKHAVFLASDDLAGRAPGSEGSAKAAQYVLEHFQRFALKPVLNDDSWFQLLPLNEPEPTSGSVTGRNIVAKLDGAGKLAREAVIVCGHYDHLGQAAPDGRGGEDTIYNGADDNASGVAALLLVAEALAKNAKSIPSPRRTVLFIAFDAEEQGLAGARNYVKRPAWPLENTSAVLNFDAMGRMRSGKFFASDVETNPMLAEAVREAAAQRHVMVETRFGGHGRSDHAVFLERGIPATQFFTGANSDYHQVTDHWASLNCAGGADIAWIGYQMLLKAITFDGRIEYRELDPSFDAGFLLNVVQQMGIVPNVNAQEGRYPEILFVLPNSMGAKHGLKSGDQITAINGLEFKRVEDGITIFQQLNFEEGIIITILRGDRTAQVKLPASAFEKLTGPKVTRRDDGMYDVLFRYQGRPGAKLVYLAGEFNDWQPKDLQMEGPDEKRQFTKRLELGAGSYQYKFVINGTEWEADPQNMYKFGTNGNSVVWVGPRK